jgi:transposase-like protein
MKHSPQGITTAMQLYFSGESLRNTARSLRLLGVQVSHKTVFMWIRKYTALIAGIRIKGKDKWLTLIQNANLEETKALSLKKSRL